MTKTFFAFLITAILIMFSNCSKDKRQVDQLEKEAMEAQADSVIADSTMAEIALEAADSVGPATPVVSPKDELSNRQYEPIGSGGYTVQIGSGINRADADRMAGLYIERGYEAFVTEVYIDNVSHYRVRIGNYETYEKAAAIGKEIKDKFSVNYWIDRNK
jgi:cell division septation protein DedD